MTLVRRSSPFGELVSLRQAMDRLFEDSFVQPRGWAFGNLSTADGFTFPIDVMNDTDEYLIEASLPGFKPEEVDITVENGTLTIQADSDSKQTQRDGETVVREIRRGTVSRSITLPTGIEADKATAEFEHGVLKVRIPKAEAVKPRQIRINATTTGSAASASSTNGSNGNAPLPAGEAPSKTTTAVGA